MSGNIVKIPLDKLIEVAEIAVGNARVGVERRLGEIQEIFAGRYAVEKSRSSHDALFAAQHLSESATALAKSLEVLHALQAARTRDQLEIFPFESAENSEKI